MIRNHTVIIGAGITGIMTAQLLHTLDPDMKITLFDAGPEPRFSNGSGKAGGHVGATLGHSRDARHFTGTEGLSFQSPVYTRLLFEPATNTSEGWCTIPEDRLTTRERKWRDESLHRFEQDVKPEDNPYDRMYVALNYGGIAAWNWFTNSMPELLQHQLSSSGVYIAFHDTVRLQSNLESETACNPFQDMQPITCHPLSDIYAGPQDIPSSTISELLRVPGASWSIQSLWSHIYQALRSNRNITFVWNSPVQKRTTLIPAAAYIWAAGSVYAVPDIYKNRGRVQGMGGWWLTIPNPGFTAPFKFVAPQPCGTMNLTPSGTKLHVSGGLGWVGERPYEEAKQLLQPTKEHFIRRVSSLLNIRDDALQRSEIDCCIRPTTPTGLPDVATHIFDGVPHITISGAGKAGATQAPLLAMHVAKELGLEPQLTTQLKHFSSAQERELLAEGFILLDRKLEP